MDTHNILFICGGAFDGLEKIIEQRTDRKGIGFDAVVESKAERRTGQLLKEVQPHDLLKFGIIPELVGRLPVIAALDGLNREGSGPYPDGAEERPGQAVSEAVFL